jgi:hypothetical protein
MKANLAVKGTSSQPSAMFDGASESKVAERGAKWVSQIGAGQSRRHPVR